jgi:hypothetical protein
MSVSAAASLTESGCQCESKPEVRLAHQPTDRDPQNTGIMIGTRAGDRDFQFHCEPRSNSGLLNLKLLVTTLNFNLMQVTFQSSEFAARRHWARLGPAPDGPRFPGNS